MDRKLYGDAPDASILGELASAGDPEFTTDSQNNDHHFIYDTDAREPERG